MINQRRNLQLQLTEAQAQIDGVPDLADLVAAAEPVVNGPPSTEAAYRVWSETVLATQRLTSSVELYDAAGSLVSRAEDLQVLALPLSLIAIAGYLLAVMALSGGISDFTRTASFVPFWSPFIMLTRLTIGRAEPWEVALAFALLVFAIAVVAILAVRVYSAGVLLYGQRPGLRMIVAAVVRPQGPATAELKVDKVELGPVGALHSSFRADVAQVAIDRCVARQDEMVAVVDRHVEHAIMIGAAPAAGLPGRLGEDDAFTTARRGDCRRQAGQAAADDMNRHPNTLQRATR